ncbi:hypothetical protein WG954_06320 [Lacibacter sp. H375]|uniref:hypothetical protein n=1 Tax=Lacibacter sp. H375 TaxID=3133424 RepID=UPI0030BCEE2D
MKKVSSCHCLTVIAVILLLLKTTNAVCQESDSVQKVKHFGGTITATQNGISLIPSFSLGRPAVMFDMNIGGKKLTFEPFFRFGTDGKPWSFVFWWRYKFVNNSKFRMSMGVHPSYIFRTVPVSNNGTSVNINRADRYAAMDLTPSFVLSKNITVGVYYLYSHGLDKTSVQNTHFITLNANFSHLKIAGNVYAKFVPQVYYLNMTGRDGFYATHSLTLAHEKFPLSLQTIMNKAIKTEIAGNSFVWNLSLIYSFNKNYIRHL